MTKAERDALKAEFITGDYRTIKEFAEAKSIEYNSTFRKMASLERWTKDKNEHLEQIYKKTVARRSKNVVELDCDNELARLIASSDDKKYKVIRDYLIVNFGGEELELPDGKTAVIDKSDAKELAHKADKKRTAELAMLKDIISKSEYYGSANNVEHNKFSRFDYYSASVRFNDEIEQIWANVGVAINDKSRHLYAITPKKE